jgi:hypothetical protein
MPLKAIMQKGVRALFLLSTAAHASPCREDRFSLFCKPRAGKWELSVGICPKTFSCSMFDNVVSCVLAAVLTGRDFLRVCPCEHDPHRDREFSALLARQGRQTRALSDVWETRLFLRFNLTLYPHFLLPSKQFTSGCSCSRKTGRHGFCQLSGQQCGTGESPSSDWLLMQPSTSP